MFKCFIGIGILATPSAISQVGIFGGAMGIILCGCLNMYTMRLQPHVIGITRYVFCAIKQWNYFSSKEMGLDIRKPLCTVPY